MMKKVIITLVLIINYNIVSQAQLLGSESVINKQVYKGDFVVNGDKNKYYPVIFKNAIANKINHLKIYRAHYESGPNELSRTHKGSLLLEFEVNYGHGSWGGIGTNWRVTNVRQTYHTTFGNASLGMHDIGFIVWLRGGGFKYHYESEYPAQLQIALNKDKIFDHSQNQYDVYAPGALDTPNHENIAKHSLQEKLANIYSTNSNVGIGTTTPTSKLDVNGNLRIRGLLIHDGADLILGANDGRPKGKKESQRALVHNVGDVLVVNYAGDFEGGVLIGGNVGIGTGPVRGYGLAVSGKMITEEVSVKLKSSWPDYVFTEDYELPSLQEVEKHIQEKGHLADIPSAKEVAKNGIQLGEMNKKLLQKIEELTLYTIVQEKQLKKQEERIKNQDERSKAQDLRLKKLEQLLENQLKK